jgi:hypothetical protein
MTVLILYHNGNILAQCRELVKSQSVLLPNKDIKNNTLSVRYTEGHLGAMSLEAILALFTQ